MFRYLTEKRRKQGFTLMEVMVVVGIIAVIAAIAIPSVINMQKNMDYKQRCDYAKTIFLAAQSNLAELRSTGELELVEDENDSARAVLQQGDSETGDMNTGNLPRRFAEKYTYTSSLSNIDGRYDVVLPVNSVESVIRDQQVIIEYYPKTGMVFAVYYAEDYANLLQDYQHGKLSRTSTNEKWLKDNLVGYYDGSDMTSEQMSEELGLDQKYYPAEPLLHYDNGQEGVLTIEIPTQSTENGVEIFFDSSKYDYYVEGLEIELTIIGENSGMFTKTIKKSGETAAQNNITVGNPDTNETGALVIPLSFTLDSLVNNGGFASIADNHKTVSDVFAGFHVLPGDNISLAAEITFASGEDDPVILFDDAVLAGVNPLFHSLTTDTSGKYVLAVSNGRHLQNLNALDPDIAAKVSKITFVNAEDDTAAPEINWDETVTHYKVVSGNKDGFTPINNRYLADAEVEGKHTVIRNLKIDESGTNALNAYYADAFADVTTDVGLFRNINGKVHDLRIVNPVIRGGNAKAVGALAGSAGSGAEVTNCYVYIDTDAKDYEATYLNLTDTFDGTNKLQYGVAGKGAVGGMVGYSKAKEFTGCLSAVPVYGDMNGAGANIVGVGGFVGAAEGGSFSKCYTSVRTVGSGAVLKGVDSSCGLGGFVGTACNARFTNCFASGNVTSQSNKLDTCGGFVGFVADDGTARKNGNALFSACYALGTVRNDDGTAGNQAKFVGKSLSVAGDIETEYKDFYKELVANKSYGHIYRDCYYLQGKTSVTNEDSETLPASFDMLYSIYGLTDAPVYRAYVYAALGSPTTLTDDQMNEIGGTFNKSGFSNGWMQGLASRNKNGHHPYQEGYKKNNTNYPYSMLTDMPFYGVWPDAPSDVGMAYWEIYEDGTLGFYYDQMEDMTLQNKTVLADGYMILSANGGREYEVVFNDGTEQEQEKKILFTSTTTIGNNVYYYGYIPAGIELVPDSFYAQVKMNDSVSGAPKTYTMYYNPNVAASQISPAGTSTTAQNPGTEVPNTILIRSARQLAALADTKMSAFWGKNYLLYGDIDFDAYGVTGNFDQTVLDMFAAYGIGKQEIAPIGNSAVPFTGSMTGYTDTKVNTAIKVIGAESGLIGTLGEGGKVSGITLNGTMTLGDGEGAFVNTMSGGTLENCTVNAVITPAAGSTSAGLVVGALNGGTISNTKSIGSNSTLGFVGSALLDEELVPVDAKTTHSRTEAFQGASVKESEIAQKGFVDVMKDSWPNKRAYKAVITEDCKYGKETAAVTTDLYYYSITGNDGYKASTTPAIEFAAVRGVKLSEFGIEQAEWKNSGYYYQIAGTYVPVYVQVSVETETISQPSAAAETDGTDSSEPSSEPSEPSTETQPQTKTTYTYTFGYPISGGTYMPLSAPKTTETPDAYEITDMALYVLKKPEVGKTYILKKGTDVLMADGNPAPIPETGISEDMVWTVGENDVWNIGEATITVDLSIPTTGSAQYPMVTVNGSQYQAYAVSVSTDRDVELVDKDPVYATTVKETENP